LTSEVATRPGRDYYAVLGIPRTADRATVRRAFRSLASELHPDVSTDPDAIERFRELAEAYEVLSRPDARARYDRLGFDARSLGDLAARDVDISRLFEDLLDLGSTASSGRKRGRDVSAVLELSAQEAFEGSRRGVHYTALTVCIACNGTGSAGGAATIVCGECGGRGRSRDTEASPQASHLRICAACRGSGRRSASPCPECGEAGRLELDRVQLVEVPPDSADGDELRIPSAGSAGARGGEPGDLVVTVRLRPTGDTPRFRKVAAVGALCALGLLAFVVVLVVLPD
jgi:molecular chaperone DnaJ